MRSEGKTGLSWGPESLTGRRAPSGCSPGPRCTAERTRSLGSTWGTEKGEEEEEEEEEPLYCSTRKIHLLGCPVMGWKLGGGNQSAHREVGDPVNHLRSSVLVSLNHF